MTSAPDGGDAFGSTPCVRSFSSITATFVHTWPLPSMSFPNRRYCVAATAWDASLTLQLHFSSEVRLSRGGLVSASEDGPCEDVGGRNAALCEFQGETSDFLDRPADEFRRVGRRRFWG